MMHGHGCRKRSAREAYLAKGVGRDDDASGDDSGRQPRAVLLDSQDMLHRTEQSAFTCASTAQTTTAALRTMSTV
jgi:hypothetical protein